MSITGKWKLNANTEIGQMVLTLDLKEENGLLTGTSDLYGSVVEIANGTVNGNKFGYVFVAVTGYGNYTLSVEGTIDKDSISGTMTGGTYVTYTGVRIADQV